MTLDEYLTASKDFAGGDNFAELVMQGLKHTGMSVNDLAREVEVIPSTVCRWCEGAAKPMVGMQKLVISKLRQCVEETHSSKD